MKSFLLPSAFSKATLLTAAAALAASAPNATADTTWSTDRTIDSLPSTEVSGKLEIGNTTSPGPIVTVTASGQLNVTGTGILGVGVNSHGTLNITEGGQVASQTFDLGRSEGYIGAVMVSGADSFLNVDNSISFSSQGGKGTLSISTGGTVKAGRLEFAQKGTSGCVATLNLLSGGTLAIEEMLSPVSTGATIALNFNGGTLRAAQSTSSTYPFFGEKGFGAITLNADGLNGAPALIFNTAGYGVTSSNNNDNYGAYTTFGGAGGFEKTGDGKLTLTGAHTYTGTTTVSGGVLEVVGQLNGGLTHAGNIVLSNGGKIVFNPASPQTFSGILSGTGIIEMGTAQSIVVAGAGRLSPGVAEGETGRLTFSVAATDSVMLSAGATFVVDLNAAATTTDLLVLDSGSRLVLDSGAALEVTVTGGAVQNETEFIIAKALNGASITGKFANGATSLTADDGQAFDIIYRKDGNGYDEVVLRRADAPSPPPPSGGTVPEPSTYALLGGTGALLLALWRKRRQRTGNAGL